MTEKIAMKHCTSCNSVIAPGEHFAEFPCPKCGKTIIIRCEKCKVLANEYTCPECGFIGP